MRKTIKVLCLVLVTVMIVGLCSGCMSKENWVTLRVGVDFAEDSEEFEMINTAIEDTNLFRESDYVKMELVSIPQEADARKSFLKDMNNGKYAMLFYTRDELLDPYIENGTLATLAEIQEVYPSCYENAKQFIIDTSVDSDGVNHSLALKGSYQAVFFNEDIFVKNGLNIPKTWEQFQGYIEKLKAAGVTPIAAGFADKGLHYIMDELILMEGGVAEHSYIPKYGVVNSWTRALGDLKGLYTSGAFNADCLTKTHDEAIELFNSGKAAMIIADSKEIATDDADTDKLGAFAIPVSATGKMNISDIICNYDMGMYFNSQYLKKRDEVIDSMVELVINYLGHEIDTTLDPDATEAEEWSYPAYKSNWSIPGNPYTMEPEPIIEDNEYVSPEDIVEVDPKLETPVKAEDDLDGYVFDMLECVTDAGRSLKTEFKTFDGFIELTKEYLTKGGNVEELLIKATDAEVAAQAAEETEAK